MFLNTCYTCGGWASHDKDATRQRLARPVATPPTAPHKIAPRLKIGPDSFERSLRLSTDHERETGSNSRQTNSLQHAEDESTDLAIILLTIERVQRPSEFRFPRWTGVLQAS